MSLQELIDELDSITGDNTEAVILISVNGPTICVRTFGHPDLCNDAVERAAEVDLGSIESPLLH